MTDTDEKVASLQRCVKMIAMRGVLLHGIMIASGAALALAFAPTDLWPLAWLALVPPLWFATADRPRLLLSGGLCFGFTWGALIVGWMVHIFPPLLALQLWFLIGVICALAIGLVGYVRRVWGLGAALTLAPLL